MNEEKTRQVEVEMTLEEASELFDKAFKWKEEEWSSNSRTTYPAHWTNFFRKYEFSPQTLSNLATYLAKPEILQNGTLTFNENRYSSGDLFIARKKKVKLNLWKLFMYLKIFGRGEIQKDLGQMVFPALN